MDVPELVNDSNSPNVNLYFQIKIQTVFCPLTGVQQTVFSFPDKIVRDR